MHLFRFWRIWEIHVCCVHGGKFGVGLRDHLISAEVLKSSVLKFSGAVTFWGIDLHVILKRSKSWRHICSTRHELGLLEVVSIVQEVHVLLLVKHLLRVCVHEIVRLLFMAGLLCNLNFTCWNA